MKSTKDRYYTLKKVYIITIAFFTVALLGTVFYAAKVFIDMEKQTRKVLVENILIHQAEQIDSNIRRAKGAINITSTILSEMITHKIPHKQILSRLIEEDAFYQTEANDDFNGLYGWIDNEYLDTSGWIPDEDYNPLERDWYKAALSGKGDPVVTRPYVDSMTGEIIVTVTEMLDDRKSVVSLDLNIGSIMSIVTNKNMHLWVIDDDGEIIANIDANGEESSFASNFLNDEILDRIITEKSIKSFNEEAEGKSCILFSVPVVDDTWRIVLLVQMGEFYKGMTSTAVKCALLFFIVISGLVIFCTYSLLAIRSYTGEIINSYEKLDKLYTDMLNIVARSIDAKDKYTKGHSLRVAQYSKEIARRFGKTEAEQKDIYYAGLMHDVGKIRVPDEIINKEGKLTEEEFDIIKLHPLSGFHILKGIKEFYFYSIAAKYHHERYDGSGYPNGISGENIPEVARIVCVADAYDAMASSRSYRRALPQHTIRERIDGGKGTQFDPRFADIMIKMIDEDTGFTMRQADEKEKRVLVVDDDPIVLKLVRKILYEESDFTVITTTNGKDAIDLVKNNKYNLVMLDLTLPDTNGFDVLKEIKDISQVPIVIMTADKSLDVIRKIKEMGADEYVTKPFLKSTFLEIIYSNLDIETEEK